MKVVVFKGKWGNEYYDISTPEFRLATFNYVLEERIRTMYYGLTPPLAKKFLDNNKSELFLESRKNYEYEDFDIVEVRQLKENV